MLYLWNKRKRLHKEIVKLHRIVLAAVSLFWNTMQYRRREVTGNLVLTTPENTITYHNALYLSPPKFSFSWELKWPQENLETMLIQNLCILQLSQQFHTLFYFMMFDLHT